MSDVHCANAYWICTTWWFSYHTHIESYLVFGHLSHHRPKVVQCLLQWYIINTSRIVQNVITLLLNSRRSLFYRRHEWHDRRRTRPTNPRIRVQEVSIDTINSSSNLVKVHFTKALQINPLCPQDDIFNCLKDVIVQFEYFSFWAFCSDGNW